MWLGKSAFAALLVFLGSSFAIVRYSGSLDTSVQEQHKAINRLQAAFEQQQAGLQQQQRSIDRLQVALEQQQKILDQMPKTLDRQQAVLDEISRAVIAKPKNP